MSDENDRLLTSIEDHLNRIDATLDILIHLRADQLEPSERAQVLEELAALKRQEATA